MTPEMGRAEDVARKIRVELDARGLLKAPVGVDVVEPPILFALQHEGITVVDGQQLLSDAREIKTQDEISLLAHSAMMVDAAYHELYMAMKPGMRENEAVGLVSKVLYDLGSEYVEGVNAIAGERCSPQPHVFSDRVLRPGDPVYYDILHSYMRGENARVAGPDRRVQTVPGLSGCVDRVDPAGPLDRRRGGGVAEGRRLRLSQRGGGVRAAVRARDRPGDLGEAGHQPPRLAGSSP